MNPTVLAPGPTKVHDELPEWLSDATDQGVFWRSNRSAWFKDIYAGIKTNLRHLLHIPADYEIVFLTSANEVWERSIESLVRKDSFHIVGGEFAERWREFARKLGRHVHSFEHSYDFQGDFGSLSVPSEAEVICVTQNETSLGFWIPEEQISTLASRHPDTLMLVDVVSSIPQVRVPWGAVDLAYWSVQKGFCLPAGLAVAVLSPRLIERSKALRASGHISSAYHSMEQLASNAAKYQTVETPNVMGIYLVSRVLEKYLAEGIDHLRALTVDRANEFYGELQGSPLAALVADARYQSPTVFSVRTSEPAEALRARLIQEHKIYTAACYGDLLPVGLRIANFPSHTREDHARFLAAVR